MDWSRIVGIQEIAERLGVRRGTVDVWRQRGQLPPPAQIRSGTPLWEWQTIEKWAQTTGRLDEDPSI